VLPANGTGEYSYFYLFHPAGDYTSLNLAMGIKTAHSYSSTVANRWQPYREQCIALCLGDNGMTEIRVSLIYIALEDCGDGRINLKMVPRFPRKVRIHALVLSKNSWAYCSQFFGHTVNNHNSLREIRQDPCGGVLDAHCKAVCYVRGGDPVKLAKDFVIRVMPGFSPNEFGLLIYKIGREIQT